MGLEFAGNRDRRHGNRVRYWIIGIVFFIVAVPFGIYQYLLYKHHLGLLPAAFEVTNVLYVSEKSWGFGPGGNETGIECIDIGCVKNHPSPPRLTQFGRL